MVIEEDTEFFEFCQKNQLIDLLFNRHKKENFATYARGKNRNDFILVSLNVIPCVQTSGYTSFAEFIHSDHQGKLLILRYKQLFHSVPKSFPKITFQKLQSQQT